MTKNILFIFLAFFTLPFRSFGQNCLDVDFGDYLTASIDTGDCTYVLGGIRMQLFNIGSPDPFCATPAEGDHAFFAIIQRSDIPLNQGSGNLTISWISGGCVGIDIFIHYTDGTDEVFHNYAEIDESIKLIEYIEIVEIECGLVYVINGTASGVKVALNKVTPPTLVSPLDQAMNQDTSLFIKWLAVPGASKYTLQIDTANTFEAPIYQVQLPSTQKYVTGLSYNRSYYWRVQSNVTTCQDTIWSDPWSFTTRIKLDLFRNTIETPQPIFEDTLSSLHPEYSYNVAADGTLTLSIARKRGTFSIRNGENAAMFGSLTDELVQNTLVTKYTAPKEYNPFGPAIFVDYRHDNQHPEPDVTLKLTIKPTPVLLLHGLASNGQVWSELHSSLNSQGLYISEQTYPPGASM